MQIILVNPYLRVTVWLHKLGMEQSEDICLYHEKDEKFSLDLVASDSKEFLFVASVSKITRFVSFMDIKKPEDGLLVLTERVDGIDTSVGHRGNHFFIKRRSDVCFNSELLACTRDDLSTFRVIVPHRPSVKIQGFQLFADFLAVYERRDGRTTISVYRLPPVGEEYRGVEFDQVIDFYDPVYAVDPLESQFSSSILRYSYSSVATPSSVFEYDMSTGISVRKKIDTVLGGFYSSNYVTRRDWATASDGTRIPISIFYRRSLFNQDGSNPLLLSGHGSHEICTDPNFKASRLSLLDRGFVFAIGHIRGGGEMGRQWYENGKLLKKKNTFTDFISCAEYLVDNKYCSKEKLCINGRGAGGLLIGAVLNMRPELFKAAVAEVPFVDVVTTMLDPTIPRTISEWEEFGDPRQKESYHYMKSYSPVDNIERQDYPAILVTARLNDSRVHFSEPAKYIAKLRDMKKDKNLLLFKCEIDMKSGRSEKLREDAFTYAFIHKALKMGSPGGNGQTSS